MTTKTPPSYEQLVMELAEQTALLAKMFSILAEDVMQKRSPKEIEIDLSAWSKIHTGTQRRKQNEAITQELFTGDDSQRRQYIQDRISSIFEDVFTILPSLTCEIRECELLSQEGEEPHYCKDCDAIYCAEHINTHVCRANAETIF